MVVTLEESRRQSDVEKTRGMEGKRKFRVHLFCASEIKVKLFDR